MKIRIVSTSLEDAQKLYDLIRKGEILPEDGGYEGDQVTAEPLRRSVTVIGDNSAANIKNAIASSEILTAGGDIEITVSDIDFPVPASGKADASLMRHLETDAVIIVSVSENTGFNRFVARFGWLLCRERRKGQHLIVVTTVQEERAFMEDGTFGPWSANDFNNVLRAVKEQSLPLAMRGKVHLFTGAGNEHDSAISTAVAQKVKDIIDALPQI